MLFLKCDVALLADAFEKFRNSRLKKKKRIMSEFLFEGTSFKLGCYA